MLLPFLGNSQNSFQKGTYISKLGDIVIRNDSVISKDISYYIYYYKSNENMLSGVTTVSYSSEDRIKVLTVAFKSGTPRHLMFNYKNYYEEAFNIAFIPE